MKNEYRQYPDEYGQQTDEYGQNDDSPIPSQDDEFEPASSSLDRVETDLNNDFLLNDDLNIEIENEGSKVASTPKKNMLILAVFTIAAGVLLYNVVFKESAEQQQKKEQEKIIEEQPIESAVRAPEPDEKIKTDIGIVETPELPKIEGMPLLSAPEPLPDVAQDVIEFEPTPEPAPPPQPATPDPAPATEPTALQQTIEPQPDPVQPSLLSNEQIITGPSAAELAAREDSRRKSGMLVMNGGGVPGEEGKLIGSPDSPDIRDLSKTGAAQVTATRIGNTDNMVAQGKMIEAVLETAINTQLPGSLRAVISRDVYAESGKAILIPKGSRLIGEYNNNIKRGQQRVVVVWNRVIRPDGVDIAISSPGTDQLGRAGMSGIVDNKYFEIISNSILLSAVTILGSAAIEAIKPSSGSTSSTTTGSDGSTTSSRTGSPTDFAVLDGIKNVGQVAEDVAGGMLDEQPVIVVNQGAKIRVFVNRDLIFPESAVGKTKFID